ncbi:hypothetical protein C8J57DRAFT_1235649 [Mycena rebaudengoi]|nr:hypothetical protein C8J57DRAFT_1235649 [Mycena rebaudengoi]
MHFAASRRRPPRPSRVTTTSRRVTAAFRLLCVTPNTVYTKSPMPIPSPPITYNWPLLRMAIRVHRLPSKSNFRFMGRDTLRWKSGESRREVDASFLRHTPMFQTLWTMFRVVPHEAVAGYFQ